MNFSNSPLIFYFISQKEFNWFVFFCLSEFKFCFKTPFEKKLKEKRGKGKRDFYSYNLFSILLTDCGKMIKS